MPRGSRTPCGKCGSFENKLPQKQFCEECRELSMWQERKRKQVRKAMTRLPCEGCGKPKGAGKRRRYCDACRELRAKPPTCQGCHERPVRAKYARLCEDCHLEAKRRERAKQVKWTRERRARLRAEGKWREQPRKYGAADLESRRIRYRLKKELQGEAVRLLPGQDRAVDDNTWPRVSTAPLLEPLQCWRRRHGGWGDLDPSVVRRATAIVNEGQRAVSLSVADQICVALGLHLDLVYGEEDLAA